MEEQIRWYLVASSVLAAPLFFIATVHWWLQNREARDSAASLIRMGILTGFLAWMPWIIFYAVTVFHPPGNDSTFHIACRWSGALFAIISLACFLRGRGWMRFVLAAFLTWPLLISLVLLRAYP
jgi:hypothetical protein